MSPALTKLALSCLLAGIRMGAPILGRIRAGRDLAVRACHVAVNANVGARAERTALALSSRCTDEVVSARLEVLAATSQVARLGADTKWAATVARALDVAEKAWDSRGPSRELVDLVTETLALVFHPRIQQAGDASPLVHDAALMEHLLAHPLLGRLRAAAPDRPAADQVGHRSASRPEDSENPPTRVLVLTDTNLVFMEEALRRWNDDPRVAVRVRDLSREEGRAPWWHLRETVTDRILGRTPVAPDWVAEDLQWADVIHCEWGGALAARLSGIDLAARLVVRLHRYEAQTLMPTLVAWNRVDHLVLVSHDVRELLRRSVPGIEERTRIHVVPNVTDLTRYDLPKHPASARTMALVGWTRVKDPAWALDVLDLVRTQDPSWRLLLVGPDPTASGEAAPSLYWRDLDARITALGESVERLGRREDVPEVLQGVGVILSTSLVESAHLALQEGAASGAVPVVRNWPWVAPLGGAARIYPAHWVVDTPKDAARRILALARPEGEAVDEVEARRWVLEHLDAQVTAPRLDAVVRQGR